MHSQPPYLVCNLCAVLRWADNFEHNWSHPQRWNGRDDGIIVRSTTLQGYKALCSDATCLQKHDRDHLEPPLLPTTPHTLPAIAQFLPKTGTSSLVKLVG